MNRIVVSEMLIEEKSIIRVSILLIVKSLKRFCRSLKGKAINKSRFSKPILMILLLAVLLLSMKSEARAFSFFNDPDDGEDETHTPPRKMPNGYWVDTGDHEDGPDKIRKRREDYLRKILPPGQSSLPNKRFLDAQKHVRQMRRYHLSKRELLPSLNGSPTGAEGNEYLVPEDAPPPTGVTTRGGSAPQPLSGPPISSNGNWQSLGPGNVGGRTRCIVINPLDTRIMYAGAATGGIFKTLDGVNWTATGLMMDLGIGSLMMDPTDPNTLYAGTGEDVQGIGIFKTTDAGATWNLLTNTSTSDFQSVSRMVCSPHNHLRVYAATNTGIWVTNDGGSTWAPLYDDPAGDSCNDIRIRTDQTTDYILASFGSWAGYLYLNTDAGGSGTWTKVLSDEGTAGSTLGLTTIDISASNQQYMYALAADPGHGWNVHCFYQSTDGGHTWNIKVDNRSNVNNGMSDWLLSYANDMCSNPATTGSGQGWYGNVIAADPRNPNVVWAGGVDQFRSDDGGTTWRLAGEWTRDLHADQHAIVFSPAYDGVDNQTMFFGTDGGVFRTDNALGTPTSNYCTSSSSIMFSFLNSGWLGTQFYNGTIYPGGATYFGGAQDNGTSRGNDSTGVNGWSFIGGGDGGFVAVDPTNTNIMFEEYTGLSISKSTDGGNNWSGATSGISEASGDFPFINVYVMDPNTPQNLWTGAQYLWRTTNEAGAWSQASAKLNGTMSAIAVAPSNSNFVVAGDGSGYIYYNTAALSAGTGTTWASTRPVAGGNVEGICFDPENTQTLFATYSNYDVTQVWKSTNGGATWSASQGSGSNAIPNSPCRTVLVDPLNSNRVFVGTDFGIFVSLDGGSTWAADTDFPAVATYTFQVDPSTYTLFAFTRGRGAYKIALSSGGAGPTPTPTISPTPELGAGTGLCGQYYSNNNLTGTACGTQIDPYIDFIMPTNGITVAGCGTMNTNFSVRWTGFIEAEFSEVYTFYTYTDDGARFIITNPSTGLPVTIINEWIGEGATEWSGVVPFAFVAGQKYAIEMDYFQGSGPAQAALRWQSADTPKERIPTRQLFPSNLCSLATATFTATSTPTISPTPGTGAFIGNGAGLCAQYYTNTGLTGSACVTQLVQGVDWVLPTGGLVVPGCGTLNTNFSIKYTGYIQPEFSENYTFTTNTDDGVRLYITVPPSGATEIINEWVGEGPTNWSSSPIALVAGTKYLIEMDYYQGSGGSQAYLMWESPNTPYGIIPTSQLYPSAICSSFPTATPTNTFAVIGSTTPTNTPTITFTPTITSTPTMTPTINCPSWIVNGNAAQGAAVTLTGAVNGQTGSAWNANCISLSSNFNLNFKVYFGANTGCGGADGMNFVLQKDARGTAAIGGGGSDKGYSNANSGTAVSPSVGFCTETYCSNGTLQPEENGSTTSTCGFATGTCPFVFGSSIDNGAEHTYNVTWNAAAKVLTLTVDGAVVMTYNRDLVANVFGGTTCVYYGFTGSTGGLNNLQYFYQTNCNTFTPTPTTTSTFTLTPTYTTTNTATSTPTNLITSTFTNTPTITSTNTATKTATATASNTSTQTATNTATMTATRTATNTATSTATHSSTNTATNTATRTPTATATNTASNTATATFTYTRTATVTNTPTNTFTFTVTPTMTKTMTPTFTPTMTATGTPTYTATLTKTVTTTPTTTNTGTASASPTLTVTMTPTNTGNAVIYPNPATGTTVSIQLPMMNAANVKVQIFTLAFREVQTINVAQVAGNTLVVPLIDKSGVNLANGLYYFVIHANGRKWMVKVLVLR